MLRTFLTLLLLCAVLVHAGETATGTSMYTCEPLFGGTRFDLATPTPLHLLIWMPTQIELHKPMPVKVLNCPPKAYCEIDYDATATMTLDTATKRGETGSYEVMRKDGTKQAGRFVTTPKKQKLWHGAWVCL